MARRSHPWRIGLPIEQWPLGDRRALEMALAPCGLFDDGGLGRHWRPDTVHRYEKAWGRYLRFLMATADLVASSAMPDRLTLARIEVYLAFMEHLGLTPRSIHGEATSLYNLIYILFPRRDLAWLRRALRRLYARAAADARPPAKLVRTDLLIAAAMLAMQAADRPGPAKRTVPGGMPQHLADSLDYRDALMVALLSVTLLRRRNFTALALGSSILRNSDCYVVIVPASEVKNDRPIEFEVYKRLTPSIDRYLAHHRPRLLRGRTSDRLWINAYGEDLRPNRVTQMVKRFTQQQLGVALSPHTFRACAASSIAELAPELVRIIQPLLSHWTSTTSERYYIKVQMIKASRRHGDSIEALRNELKRAPFN